MSEARLSELLQQMPGAVVALSGGVDSSLLLAVAVETLGVERVLAVVADTPSLARSEFDCAQLMASEIGVELRVLSTAEFSDQRYLDNSGDRCYWCKEALFESAIPLAVERGWVMCYGENASDDPTDRPGSKSAARHGVRAPLREAGMDKQQVRVAARARGLSVADKPAMPCLSSRIPIGIPVTMEALERVEKMENSIRKLGFQVLRARDFGTELVRVEIGASEFTDAEGARERFAALAIEAGYTSCELAPYN